ncbi:hypothetical protein ACE6H2_016264 [Prunus campanulata]
MINRFGTDLVPTRQPNTVNRYAEARVGSTNPELYQTICIWGFEGRPDEMEEAKYLLKHGEVLNNLIIYTRDFHVEHMMELRQ